MANEPAPVFKVDGADFTDCVGVSKLKWQKNDLDSDASGRPKSTLMRRTVIGKKRKLSVTCVRLTFTRVNQLGRAIDKDFIDVTFLDPILGVTTKTFYGTSIDSTTVGHVDGVTYFDDTSFDLVEK